MLSLDNVNVGTGCTVSGENNHVSGYFNAIGSDMKNTTLSGRSRPERLERYVRSWNTS